MKKLIIVAVLLFESFWLKGALAQIEIAPTVSKTKMATVAQDSSGWERIPSIGVRLLHRGDKIVGGFQSTTISDRMIVRGGISVSDDSANGSLTSLSTAGGSSNFVAGRVGAGSFLPLKFWTNGSIRGTFATDGGFFMEGATGTSQGAGTINATGLYVNGVAVGGGGPGGGWTDGTNVVYVTDVSDSAGIGITTPSAKLHLHLRGINQASSFKITTPTTGTSVLTDGFDMYYSSGNLYATNRETGNLYLRANDGNVVLNTNSTDRVYVTSTGEILIGTATTAGKLAVYGASDQTQLWVRSHSTQTDTLVRFLKHDGTNIFTLFNTGQLTLEGTSPWLSVPDGTLSERFGSGAQASGSNSFAAGYDAQANVGAANIAIGRSARSNNTTGATIAIGNQANMSGQSSVGIGDQIASSGNFTVLVGSGSAGNFNGSKGIGQGLTLTGHNQFVAGSTNAPTTDVYFGNGEQDNSPAAYSIHGTNAAFGQTNLAGASVKIAGGVGTGSGVGGDVEIRTASAGGSGTSQNPLTTRLTVKSDGGIFTNGATGGSQGDGTINATGLYVNGVAVGGSGISVATARRYVGLTATGAANGTAQDTLATRYILDAPSMRIAYKGSDNDSLIFHPIADRLLSAKIDGATEAVAIDTSGKLLLMSGHVTDWNAADVTLTHSANKLTVAGGDLGVPDLAYDATTWNGSDVVPTRNAIRDKIESMGGGGFNPDTAGTVAGSILMARASKVYVDTTNVDVNPDVFVQWELPSTALIPAAGDLTGATYVAYDADNTNDWTLPQIEFSASVDNYISFAVRMPSDWDASTAPKFKIVWYSATGHASNMVAWSIATGYTRPGTDSWKAALGSEATTTQNPTTADIWYSTSTLSPTPSGTAAANCYIRGRIFRDGDAAGDTHTATSRIMSVVMEYKKTSYGNTSSM